MARKTRHASSREAWALARKQHDVITRKQLLALGFSREAIDHRIARGRLHIVHRGVYAVGRRELTQNGRWMAAVLYCGPGAALAGYSAAALYGIRPDRGGPIEVAVASGAGRKVRGVVVHRRPSLSAHHLTTHDRIPVITIPCVFVDLAARLPRNEVEAALNEADSRDLIDPDTLRAALDDVPQWPGVAKLRKTLDRRTLVLTRSELERRFLPIARRAGLPRPETRCWVNGFEVDFYFRELDLIVEADSLRYHRTPQQQAKDRVRDQTHAVALLTPPLRFTHDQIVYEPAYVEETLKTVARRLASRTARRALPPGRAAA